MQRVDARIKKRRSDLTASRGELIEVNVESAFEPIIQGPGHTTNYIYLPTSYNTCAMYCIGGLASSQYQE